MATDRTTQPNEADTSAGPYTPLESPSENLGNESGGEYQWRHASATPQTKQGT
jgi:hypothetical protein